MQFLVVGLGNPGAKYLLTRHNVGFMLMDALASTQAFKSEHKAETFKLMLGDKKILLAKPQTFMNLSGQAVQALVQYYKIAHQNILIVHDEIDLAFGMLRYKKGGSAAGHNGVKNIYEQLGTQDIVRLRVGVGPRIEVNKVLQTKSLRQQVHSVSEYVLNIFSQHELQHLPEVLDVLCNSVELFVHKGWAAAANQYNAGDICASV